MVLHSVGTTWFESCKLLTIDGSGAHLTLATTCARTCYVTDNICTTLPRLLGRISLRIARRRETKGHGQASSIISQNSQRDIGHGFDVAMDQELAKATKSVADPWNQLPKNHPLAASGIHSRTCMNSRDTAFMATAARWAGTVSLRRPPNDRFSNRASGSSSVAILVGLVVHAGHASLRSLMAPFERSRCTHASDQGLESLALGRA